MKGVKIMKGDSIMGIPGEPIPFCRVHGTRNTNRTRFNGSSGVYVNCGSV